MSEDAVHFQPDGLDGVEALHARFVRQAYRPHSHPTWTVAVVERGAARFTVDATDQRAGRGELFVLEPEAVHTGMAEVPEGWPTSAPRSPTLRRPAQRAARDVCRVVCEHYPELIA